MIRGVDFIQVFTTDFERSVAFYGNVLGLSPGKRYVRVPGMEFEAGNVTLVVIQCDAIGLEFVPNTQPIAFSADDIEQEQRRLQGLGITFSSNLDSGVCRMALFNDPDGNLLMLHNRYADEEAD